MLILVAQLSCESAAQNAARATKVIGKILKDAARKAEGTGHIPPVPKAPVPVAQIVQESIDRVKLAQWRKRYAFAENVIQESICAEIGHALRTKDFPTFNGFVDTVKGNLLGHAVPGGEALNAATEIAEMLYEKSDMSLSERFRILRWQIEECPRY
ncbi:MAG TPA: hypothetical protein VES88_16490 [Gemmatimonadaceae bacterium]|nr:hypothetical protein [Gemmatimonadaceae bacterium]